VEVEGILGRESQQTWLAAAGESLEITFQQSNTINRSIIQ